MADVAPTGKTLETYYDSMFERMMDSLAHPSVRVSLTQQMMKTVKAAVLAGCSFGDEAFPIIRSLDVHGRHGSERTPKCGFDFLNGSIPR